MTRKLLGLLMSLALLSFINDYTISKCYTSFGGSKGLANQPPERLPETSEKFRELKTNNGIVKMSRIDGYRVLYNNAKGAPFVNLKVELSEEKSYSTDTTALIENLRYLNSVGQNMKTKDLIESLYNGYKVYGLSRNSIEQGTTLATFAMFPGNNITVYFYFNNLNPSYRNFETIEDFEKQRDGFLADYTLFLKSCNK
jgi:hypothetical protein